MIARRSKRMIKRTFSWPMLLIVLLLIVAFHLVILLMYTNSNLQMEREFRKTEIIHTVVSIIHLADITPIEHREQLLRGMHGPNLSISITQKPKWSWRFTHYNLWKIGKQLKHPEQPQVSFQLHDGSWINFKATISKPQLHIQILLIIIDVIVLTAVLICMWTFRRFAQPLKQFKVAADRLGIDINTEPLTTNGPSLVRESASAMNKMQQRIKGLIRDRTQMLAAISHDLRTPITRLKLRAQNIHDPEQYKKVLKDLNEMELMINQILAFAKEDSQHEEETWLDLVSLISSICEDMIEMGYNIEFSTEVNRVRFHGRPIALKRVFTNIINNAERYSKAVWVSLVQGEHSVTITVADDGPGIPEQDIEKVLQPFYQVDTRFPQQGGNVGLGLAVAKQIIQFHGGELTLKNREGGGLAVNVELPL